MIIRDLTQSSDEWLDWRLSKFTASDAAAAVKGGAARQKLLHEKHTGERKKQTHSLRRDSTGAMLPRRMPGR